MTKAIEPILNSMSSITLKEMKDIHLMDRVDSKFVTAASMLPRLLNEMSPYFKVQLNNNSRIAHYTTQYLDTHSLAMYLMHQNGKLNRQKIRIRTYVESQTSFLEIKNKNNKGRTHKTRVSVHTSHISTIDELANNREFLQMGSFFDIDTLHPSLDNEFRRITLVNNRATERITVDLELSFFNRRTRINHSPNNLIIIELKQNGRQRSDFQGILTEMRLKPLPFSKYCMGIISTDPSIKYNRFKERQAIINKITL